ncbi:hypothetical protein [Janthinobacterium fluminis]|uniref:DUF3829 domain-containing protein n=1 Tax=Janthinobacterium fluminis TaxID=2987524 RepID=A0ABT5K536_9BURK|nr:hypothetical protein [Janthinobacterium fluminis]MDC8760100.1 hypothetical protein [Janthinobacterium fluminis]
MTLLHRIAALALVLTVGGCATATTARLREVREFAAESAKLDAFAALTTRYCATYQREKPYLSAAADSRERALDARRRTACPDFLKVQQAVVLYMQTLGRLAGAEQQDVGAPIKEAGAGIQAWPDSGLDERHVDAYTALGRLLAQTLTSSYRDKAAQEMLRDGDAPVRSLLEAMAALLRHYDKSNANEQGIVLGLFEVEIAFADAPRDRLLATLARAHHQHKAAEYALAARRHSLAEQHLAAIAEGQRALLAYLAQQPDAAPPGASLGIRASRVALDTSTY